MGLVIGTPSLDMISPGNIWGSYAVKSYHFSYVVKAERQAIFLSPVLVTQYNKHLSFESSKQSI